MKISMYKTSYYSFMFSVLIARFGFQTSFFCTSTKLPLIDNLFELFLPARLYWPCSVMDSMRIEQRSLIKYFHNNGKTLKEITELLKEEYGDAAFSKVAIFKWIKQFENGRKTVCDLKRKPRFSVITPDLIERIRGVIQDDRRSTIDFIASLVGVSHGTVHTVIRQHLGMSKKTCRWVPHCLTDDQKQMRLSICEDLLARRDREGRRMMSRIITGDETFVHFYEPESKAASKQWVEKGSPSPTKYRAAKSVRKVMLICFWDVDGVLLKHFVQEGQTVNAEYYAHVLKTELGPALSQHRPHLRPGRVLIQHDNARPHTAHLTQAAVAELGWEVLAHPPYSPDLAPSDFFLFGRLKSFLQGRSFRSRAGIASAVHQWAAGLKPEDFEHAINQLRQRWARCVELRGDYVEV